MAQLPEYELMAKMSEELDRLRQQNAQLLEALVNLLVHFEMQEVTDGFAMEVKRDPIDPNDPFDIFAALKAARAAIAAAEGRS
jgi:hypothetical protein